MNLLAKKHIRGFDYLRVIAAFSVVWIHACHTNQFLSWFNLINSYAVPAFILTSIYLFGHKYDEKDIDTSKALFNIIKKVIPQYIFWSIVYLILRYIKTWYFGKGFYIDYYTVFFGGSSVQLWFLPALLIWHAFITVYWHKVNNVFIDIFLMILTFFIGRYLMTHGFLREGFLNCFAIYFGYVFIAKMVYQNKKNILRINSYWFLLGALLAVFLRFSVSYYILDIAFATCLFMFFLAHDFKEQKYIKSLSMNSFGIYLAHFVIVQFFLILAGILNINTSNIFFTMGNIVLSFLLSYFLSLVFKKHKQLSKVV